MEIVIGNYYGLDWMAMIVSILFVYFIGEKKRYGFILGMIANAGWMMVNGMANIWPGVIVNVILFFLNYRGYVNWGNRNKTR